MNKKNFTIVVLIGIAALTALFFMSRGGTRSTGPAVSVAATVFPLYDLVRSIGGDAVDATLLLPAGESPGTLEHLYERGVPQAAQIIFAVGHGFDDRNVPDALQEKVYRVDRDVELLLEQGSTASPYYWLSVRRSQIVARNIALKLAELSPANRNYFEQRLGIVLQNLAFLDANISELLKAAPHNKLAVYGYDWSYFASDYDLDIVWYYPPVAGELPAQAAEELRNAIEDFGMAAVYGDATLDSAPLLPAVLVGKVSLINLDVFGGLGDRTSYEQLMASNARALFEGLNGVPPS